MDLTTTVLIIAALIGLAACLYTMVGHGGASAYLAIMALLAVAPEVMRPTALALNLVAAGIATIRYVHAGQINWRLLAMFVVTAAPAAYLGGGIPIAPDLYRPLVGIVLILVAVKLFWSPSQTASQRVAPPRLWIALPVGAGLGLLAGLTGTGGGIFLSPLVILLGWEDTRKTSGVAAAFILINSAAGLAGNYSSIGSLPAELPLYAAMAAAGALIGSWLGARRLDKSRLLQGLGVVLLIAGTKLIFT